MSCHCEKTDHLCRFVAVTGGPSAGKTALLEVVRRHFCDHVGVLPESATLVFGGGFPRLNDDVSRRASQRAIFKIQVELERWAKEMGTFGVVLCDRGTLDGLAYWPGTRSTFFAEMESSEEAELARYDAVIHLHTPLAAAYDRSNPIRVENPEEAAILDGRILDVWRRHSNRVEVAHRETFLAKLTLAVEAVRDVVPACCQHHAVPEVDLA